MIAPSGSGLRSTLRALGTRTAGLLSPPPSAAPRTRGETRKSRPRLVRDSGPPQGGGGDRDGGGGNGGDGGSGEGAGDGAPERRATPSGSAELAFGFLLAGICTLFLVFLFAFALLRDGESWPATTPLSRSLPSLLSSSALLLASERAVARSARAPGPRAARRPLAVAALLGSLFLLSQAWLWRALLLEGLSAGSDAYGAVFYSLTGLHALHVAGGLAYMLLLLARLRRAERGGREGPTAGLRLCGLYWRTMGGIWVVLLGALLLGA